MSFFSTGRSPGVLVSYTNTHSNRSPWGNTSLPPPPHLWQSVDVNHAIQRHVTMEGGELDIHQFLGVEGPVPVAADRDGLGQQHPSSVDSLENAHQVHASGDLLDQHGGHSLGPQLLVYAQEIDLYHSPLTTAINKLFQWNH